MPKSKYDAIYKDLKLKIEAGDFPGENFCRRRIL